jgi:hypothetical protein
MYDDTSLPTSPDWTRVGDQQGFYFGTYTMTRTLGATTSVAGTFSRVAVTAYHCPACGSVDVYAGSRKLASLNLASRPGREGLVQWTSPMLPTAASTLTLQVTSRNRIVAVDGFGLAR